MIPQVMLLNSAVVEGRVFGLDLQTLISISIMLFNIIVLAIILSKLLYNPVRNFMQKRTDRIKRQISQAESDLMRADELKSEYEKKLSAIELERNEILDSARKAAAEKAKEVLSEAKNEADLMKARAASDIQLEQDRVKDEMKQSVISIASVMAAKFVEQNMDTETQNKLFNEAAAELEDLTWLN